MENTKVKRVRKIKVPKVEEPVIESIPEPEIEPTIEPSSDNVFIKARKNNAWIEHVKDYRVKHPDVSYTVAMKEAKLTYKK